MIGWISNHPEATKALTRADQVKPWGNYSMCAIVGADDLGRGE